MTRVLLTGHLGYVGSVMAPVLAAAGHEVVGLDSGLFAGCLHGPAPAALPELRVDLRDVTPDALAGLGAVVHLAALSNDPLGDLDPEHTFAINHRASVRLAELAKAAGVPRFLYASSCSVYGAGGTGDALDETAPLAPLTAYAESKIAVEGELSALADAAFSPTSLRNATAFGWSPRLRLDIVLNDLVARAVLTGKVTVLSDGTPWRPLVHVADFSEAFRRVLEADRDAIHDVALNVGSAEANYQIADIAQIVVEEAGGELEITGETGADPRSYRVDFRRLSERVPAFRAAWDARRGARELVARFAEHGLDAEGFARTYRRLPSLAARRDAGTIDATLRPARTAA